VIVSVIFANSNRSEASRQPKAQIGVDCYRT